MTRVGGADARVVVSLVAPGASPGVLPEDALERLRAAGLQVQVRVPQGRLGPADVADWVGPDAWAVLTSWGSPAFTAEAVDRLPGLRCIGYLAGSVKHVVAPEVLRRGITVLSAAPVIARGVAEYCLAAALWLLRDLGRSAAALAADPGPGGWRAGGKSPASRSLWGLPVGVVSASTTGRRFIELLRPFGARVAVYDPYLPAEEARRLGVERAGLDEVCARPLVSVHAPDLPATRGLVGAAEIARIPDGGVLINSSRGAVVDYAALTEHLLAGRIRAALDVFPQEPLPASSPLYGLSNVLLTPHLAGYSRDVYAAIGREVVADLLRLHAGEPASLAVDAARWDILA